MKFTELFEASKPLIGCIHLLALPGSPRYGGRMREVYDTALREVDEDVSANYLLSAISAQSSETPGLCQNCVYSLAQIARPAVDEAAAVSWPATRVRRVAGSRISFLKPHAPSPTLAASVGDAWAPKRTACGSPNQLSEWANHWGQAKAIQAGATGPRAAREAYLRRHVGRPRRRLG